MLKTGLTRALPFSVAGGGPLDAFKPLTSAKVNPSAIEAFRSDAQDPNTVRWGNGLSDMENLRRKATVAQADGDPNAMSMIEEWQRQKIAENQRKALEEARRKGELAAAQQLAQEDAMAAFRPVKQEERQTPSYSSIPG